MRGCIHRDWALLAKQYLIGTTQQLKGSAVRFRKLRLKARFADLADACEEHFVMICWYPVNTWATGFHASARVFLRL